MTSKEDTIDKIYHNVVTDMVPFVMYTIRQKKNVQVLHTMMLDNISIHLMIGK